VSTLKSRWGDLTFEPPLSPDQDASAGSIPTASLHFACCAAHPNTQRLAAVCPVGSEPVANAYAQTANPFHPTNASGEFRTQQAGIRRLIFNSSNGCEAQIDRRWGVLSLFETDPVTQHDSSVERQSRLRAVPLHEFRDRVIVSSLPLFDVSVLRTVDFACSRSGKRGRVWVFAFSFEISAFGGGLL